MSVSIHAVLLLLQRSLEQKQFPPGINKVFWIWIWKANVYLVHLLQQEVPKIDSKFQEVTEDQFLCTWRLTKPTSSLKSL